MGRVVTKAMAETTVLLVSLVDGVRQEGWWQDLVEYLNLQGPEWVVGPPERLSQYLLLSIWRT